MIASDQPTCFPPELLVKVSSKSDGSLLNRESGIHDSEYITRRQAFCLQAGIDYADTVYQRIVYQDTRSYHLIAEVDDGSTTKVTPEVVADALYTTATNVGLFLPVADCAATVVYDPVRKALAVAHLGRHSTYAKLAARLARHFMADGSSAADLIIWMSPHAQKQSYKLAWFDRADDQDWQGYFEPTPSGTLLDLAGFNRQQFMNAGVQPSNIYVSPVDTMVSADYFSHATGDTTGRIAVIVCMR